MVPSRPEARGHQHSHRLTSQAFQRPVLVMIWPETVEETNRPAIIGIVMTPDIVGDLSARQLEVLAEEDGAGEHRDTDEQRGRARPG